MISRLLRLCALLTAVFAVPAQATSETNKTIAHVGVQGAQGYVTLTTAPSAGCTFANVYFSLTSDAGKGYLSMLLSARAGGRAISRIDYTKAADGTCTIDLLED